MILHDLLKNKDWCEIKETAWRPNMNIPKKDNAIRFKFIREAGGIVFDCKVINNIGTVSWELDGENNYVDYPILEICKRINDIKWIVTDFISSGFDRTAKFPQKLG